MRCPGRRCGDVALVVEWQFTDSATTVRTRTTVRISLSSGALIRTDNPRSKVDADLTVTLTNNELPAVLAGLGLDGVEHTGDPGVLATLFGLLETPDPAFAIVTP